jgi:hypothetical protein
VTGRAKQCPEFQKTILWVYILDPSKMVKKPQPVGIKGDEPSFPDVSTAVLKTVAPCFSWPYRVNQRAPDDFALLHFPLALDAFRLSIAA